MLDIHAHLQFPDFDADRDAVILRARAAGVERMIIVGTDLVTSRAAIALAEKHEFLLASVGIHPHEFGERLSSSSSPFRKGEGSSLRDGGVGMRTENITPHSVGTDSSPFGKGEQEGWVQELREMARHPKVVAIGECGLDYFMRNQQPITDNQSPTTNNPQQKSDALQLTIGVERKTSQRDGFLAQVGIARELGLPLIIHTRPSAGTMDSYEDVYEILTENQKLITHNEATRDFGLSVIGDGLTVALHCYQGDTRITEKFLSLPGVYFSFAGNVTYPVKKALAGSGSDILETVKLVPLERLFVETDCPYLAPQEHRGTRNEPSYVRLTAEKVAAAKGVGVDEIEAAVAGSFDDVFLGRDSGLI